MSKHILIFGGAGFLGANLVRHCLKESDIQITVVDSLDPALLSTKASLDAVADRITFIQGDLRDITLLKRVIPEQDIIFNCAAQTSHSRSLEDPIFDTEVNCIGNLRLLTAIRDYNPSAVVIYPSSSTVIGKAVNEIIDEQHGEKPLDIYSANKGVAEKYYRIFNRLYDLKTVVLRFANLYGPFGKNNPAFGFANYFIQQTAIGNTITIFGDGNQTRNLMFVDDATDILWKAAFLPQLIGETYFAVHSEHYSVKEVAESIIEIFNSGKLKLTPWPNIRKRMDIENVLISSARLRELTGWKANYTLKEGLKITYSRIKENY